MSVATLDNRIVELVRQTVREDMQAFGLRDVSVQVREDHAGEPALFIEAEYNPTPTPIDIAVMAALTTKLRDKLWAAGETRFPHIRHKFPEEPKFQKKQKVKPRRRANA